MNQNVRRIQGFSRFARVACAVALAFVSVVALTLILGILFEFRGTRMSFGPYIVEGPAFAAPLLKLWGIACAIAIFALVLRWLFHIHALFGSLAMGHIHTAVNVRRLRQIAFVMLYQQALLVVIGLVSWCFLNAGLVVDSQITRQEWGITGGTFLALLSPGIVLLASWIMEVGRQSEDDAAQMRREAWLVI